MYTIYWYHFGAINMLTTNEYDTLIDFLDMLSDEDKEFTMVHDIHRVYTVNDFLETNKGVKIAG